MDSATQAGSCLLLANGPQFQSDIVRKDIHGR